MNILLINHYAGSPKYGMEYRPYYLAIEWIKLGHNVRIVASSESHLHQLKPLTMGSTTVENINGIQYLWLKTPRYFNNGLKRIINMFYFSIKLFLERKKIIDDFSPNIVIASSPHPFIFRGASYIAKKSRAKLIYEVRDLWPLSLIELLGMSSFHPLILLMQHEENYAYKHAYKVASLLPNAYQYMSNHGLIDGKFIYSPNGIVINAWNNNVSLPNKQLDQIKLFRSQFSFLIGYAGSHGVPNALSFFVDAANLIKEYDIGIVLIGNGSEKKLLISQAKKLNLRNIIFLDAVNKNAIPCFLKQMDALYIGWEHQPLYRFGISANKIFEYMMSGKPIIHSVAAGNDPVSDSVCGVSCEPENYIAIFDSIIKVSNMSKEERKLLGSNGKKYVMKHFDYTVLARQYLDALS